MSSWRLRPSLTPAPPAFAQCRQARLRIMIGLSRRTEHTDAAYAFALLRTHRKRPRSSGTSQNAEKLPPPHDRPLAQDAVS